MFKVVLVNLLRCDTQVTRVMGGPPGMMLIMEGTPNSPGSVPQSCKKQIIAHDYSFKQYYMIHSNTDSVSRAAVL